MLKKESMNKSLEWLGVLTAIVYSMLVASNIGNEGLLLHYFLFLQLL